MVEQTHTTQVAFKLVTAFREQAGEEAFHDPTVNHVFRALNCEFTYKAEKSHWTPCEWSDEKDDSGESKFVQLSIKLQDASCPTPRPLNGPELMFPSGLLRPGCTSIGHLCYVKTPTKPEYKNKPAPLSSAWARKISDTPLMILHHDNKKFMPTETLERFKADVPDTKFKKLSEQDLFFVDQLKQREQQLSIVEAEAGKMKDDSRAQSPYFFPFALYLNRFNDELVGAHVQNPDTLADFTYCDILSEVAWRTETLIPGLHAYAAKQYSKYKNDKDTKIAATAGLKVSETLKLLRICEDYQKRIDKLIEHDIKVFHKFVTDHWTHNDDPESRKLLSYETPRLDADTIHTLRTNTARLSINIEDCRLAFDEVNRLDKKTSIATLNAAVNEEIEGMSRSHILADKASTNDTDDNLQSEVSVSEPDAKVQRHSVLEVILAAIKDRKTLDEVLSAISWQIEQLTALQQTAQRNINRIDLNNDGFVACDIEFDSYTQAPLQEGGDPVVFPRIALITVIATRSAMNMLYNECS